MNTAPSLRNLQQQFMTALYDADVPGPLAAIAGNGLTAAARLRIYRNSCEETQVAALHVTYPALVALVGDAFFDQTARGYRRAHPSQSGNLQAFGASLGDYVATLASCTAYPYFADVARLEWLRQATILAPDAATLDPVAWAGSAPASDAARSVALHPSLHLLASAYPVLRLWRFALHPSPEVPTLDAGESVVLWREDGEVAMTAVDAASFACIAALRQGASVGAAETAACVIDPEFDLAMCVGSLLQRGLVAGMRPQSGDADGSRP